MFMTTRHLRRATIVALTLGLTSWCTACGALGDAVSGPKTVTISPPSATQDSAATVSATGRGTATEGGSTPSAEGTTNAAGSLKDVLPIVSPAIVRVDVSGCAGQTSGTGFLVGPSLVATDGHLVENGATGRVTRGTRVSAFRVIGHDEGKDVALLSLDTTVGGTPIAFAAQDPRMGDVVATVGYALGGNMSYHEGVISGLNRKVAIDNDTSAGLVEHSSAALAGDTGGPLIDASGAVVGLHRSAKTSEGRRFAVPALAASALVTAWQLAPQAIGFDTACDALYDLDDTTIDTDEFQAVDVQAWHSVTVYAAAMNRGDWQTAGAQFITPRSAAESSKTASQSQITSLTVLDMWRSGDKLKAWVTFDSQQPEGDGPPARREEQCTTWSLDYTFAKKNGLWLISKVTGHSGRTTSYSCEYGD